MKAVKIEMLGKRFGRWVVVGEAGRDNRSQAMWRCRCDCGSVRVTRGAGLRNGSTKSCGCLTLDVNRTRMTKHGRTHTSEHNIWLVMRDRCRNPRNHKFANYGGRGIAVCARWDSFENFLSDMGPKPGPGYSIDRIDNDGNYEPSNCRWATPVEQRANQRSPAQVLA